MFSATTAYSGESAGAAASPSTGTSALAGVASATAAFLTDAFAVDFLAGVFGFLAGLLDLEADFLPFSAFFALPLSLSFYLAVFFLPVNFSSFFGADFDGFLTSSLGLGSAAFLAL